MNRLKGSFFKKKGYSSNVGGQSINPLTITGGIWRELGGKNIETPMIYGLEMTNGLYSCIGNFQGHSKSVGSP